MGRSTKKGLRDSTAGWEVVMLPPPQAGSPSLQLQGPRCPKEVSGVKALHGLVLPDLRLSFLKRRGVTAKLPSGIEVLGIEDWAQRLRHLPSGERGTG